MDQLKNIGDSLIESIKESLKDLAEKAGANATLARAEIETFSEAIEEDLIIALGGGVQGGVPDMSTVNILYDTALLKATEVGGDFIAHNRKATAAIVSTAIRSAIGILTTAVPGGAVIQVLANVAMTMAQKDDLSQ